ncbi:MAG: TAT-variant-translocated molybdopterin oxidoreductase [Saprospiraceae bacterium]|nr:TAT-variant-translocated molybdopterin oxidoreductase [Saprospiraceae bacterium]
MNKKENKNKAWVSVEDLTKDPSVIEAQQQEFLHTEENETNDPNRRDFLKYMGFSLGAASLASCEIPLKKAIPYVVKPEEIVPGIATYYASAIVQGGDVTPALIKTREGRPILVEGNPGIGDNKTFTQGGSCVRSQASVLSLYDTERQRFPGKVENGKVTEMSWTDIDNAISSELSKAKNIRIVTQTNNSPSFNKALHTFQQKFTSAKVVQYDSISYSAAIQANREMFNSPWMPSYHLEKAKCIVAIDCDFLGTWLSPTEFSNGYVANRKINDEDIANAQDVMSTHIQFEARMSLTGSNADHRVLIKPSEMGAAVGRLYKEVCELMNIQPEGTGPSTAFSWPRASKSIKDTAKKLVANRGRSVVMCGINDVNIQKVVNQINTMISAYNSTIVLTSEEHSKQRMGDDGSIQALLSEMKMGLVDAIIVCPGANPAYDIPGLSSEFATAINKVPFSVSLELSLDETASLCNYIVPDRHNLEAWGDAEPKKGEFYLIQPTIAPLFSSRDAGESILKWSGLNTSYYDFVKDNWKVSLFPSQSNYMVFQSFWDNSLHDGWVKINSVNDSNLSLSSNDDNDAETVEINSGISSALLNLPKGNNNELEVILYESVQLGNGHDANNPWLQEFPDPIMRTTWDNFIQIPIKWNGGTDYEAYQNLKDGDYATISIDGVEYTLPVFRQFGQMEGTVSIALGYGRTKAGKCGDAIGVNLFPSVRDFNYSAYASSLSPRGDSDPIYANIQMHHTYGLNTIDESTGEVKMHTYKTGEQKPFNIDEHIDSFQGAFIERSVFFQSNADKLEKNVEILADKRKDYQYLNSKTLYPDRQEFYDMGHHWGMAIDLNSCTGCGACVIACHAENNVPVVGKYEFSKHHDMTWLRIDRYFYGDQETPHAVYMPMMCQHCDNAPCENVCPVAATNHSSEGLNQMTYNRCVGTRYCANNCPFKVRRFNWLDYTSADLFPSNEVDINRGTDKDSMYYLNDNLTRMVLNPDVTVRSRGVIEKCSFCVQKIQEGKLMAKMEGRKLEEEDINCACATACSTRAIVFGDTNDPNSKVSKLQATKRAYLQLEETNVRSSVSYLMKVNNRDENFG